MPAPMGISFLPIKPPWGRIWLHPRPLIGEFLAGNRGSGPHCHLESRSPERRRGRRGRHGSPVVSTVYKDFDDLPYHEDRRALEAIIT